MQIVPSDGYFHGKCSGARKQTGQDEGRPYLGRWLMREQDKESVQQKTREKGCRERVGGDKDEDMRR